MEKILQAAAYLKNVVYFSLPFLLSYFLQTLYGMADLFIIGRYEGVEGTAAVSVGSQVMHMLTVMIVGLAMGTTVAVDAVGAKNREEVSKTSETQSRSFLAISAALTVILMFFRSGIVSLLSTPEQAAAGAVSLPDRLLCGHTLYNGL